MTLVHDDLLGIDVDSARLLGRMAAGSLLSRAIYVACKLELPDLCAASPRTPAELAGLTGSNSDALLSFLRVLAGCGIFAEDGDGRFELTAFGAPLQRNREGSMWPFVIISSELLEPTSTGALYAARTGKPAFDHAHRCGIYEHLAGHPDHDALFSAAMTSRATRLHAGVIEAIDWANVQTIVDVGGAHGAFLTAILHHLPWATGVLFDQPHVVATADLDASGVGSRVSVVGGDFFHSVPEGGDVYLVANVLWNWPDADAVRILRRCRAAMRMAGRLIIVEPVIPPGNDPHPAKNLDLANLLVFGGRSRDEHSWRDLMDRAGFEWRSTTVTASEWSVLEARPA